MSSKEKVCFRILMEYGIMIDGPEDVLSAVNEVPKLKDGETFNQWEKRLFGKDVDVEIQVYGPYEPAPQTRISTLIRNGGGEHLKGIFKRYGRFKERKTEKVMSTFPRKTLESLLKELDDELEKSVEEFFIRYIKSNEENIDTKSLLRHLIKVYNDVVRRYRTEVLMNKVRLCEARTTI